jgi:hypothetical protein
LIENESRRTIDMTEPATSDGTLAHHLSHLAATADDLAALLSRPHEEGEIHPEALAESEHLSTSLKDVIHALTKHEHLAMTGDDVWRALSVKHVDHTDGTVT